MSTFRGTVILSSVVVALCVIGALGNITSTITDTEQPNRKHFKDFSYNLLLQSDLDEFSVEKGAAISSPFGVGYMLANINEKVWNVSNDGVNQVLNSPDGKVAEDYRALIDILQKGKMSVSSTLFTRDANITSQIPEGSRKMKTETKLVDFVEDWKTTWLAMNAKISNQTNSRLDDQLIPKGGWWGGAFYFFTMGAFINTNHYKGSWDATWTDVGSKKFHDGLSVPFYETAAEQPALETEKYTAVAIKLKDGKKTVVFALPKVSFVEFLKTEMTELVKNGSPDSWTSKKTKKIQIPSLNITLLDQHYKKLEALGLNYTFCVDEPESLDVAMKKGTYFMGPIVQSHHFQFTPQFFEVASATGSSLNSEEKMREESHYNLPDAPSGPSGPETYSASSPDSTGNSEQGSEFVLPLQLDAKLAKSLADGEVEVKKVDVIVADDDKNGTLTAAASSVEEVTVPAPPTAASLTVPVNVNSTAVPNVNATSAYPANITITTEDIAASSSTATTTNAPLTTTPFVTEPLPENTIRFDRPFFWYLYDEEMGPLYYGTIHSLATYQREYGIETDEDLWLYDAYKTLLWNCP